jgi:hypothetical protein
MARRSIRAPLLALAILASLAAPTVAAPPDNVLSNGGVTPSGGTTATTFTFTVDYSGTPATVTASVGNLTVPMNLVSGAETDGTFRGSAKLPAGRWRITFNANTARGKDASPLVGPVVTVAALATPQPTVAPTPRPTAAPTPVPTPAPPPLTATPLPPGGGASTTPGEGEPSASGFLGGFLETPIPAATGAESAVGGSGPSDELWTLAMGGLIAISVLAFVAMVAILRNRSVAGYAGADLSAFFGDADGDANPEERPMETVTFVPRNPDE